MTNPGSVKPAESMDERRGNAPEATEADRVIRWVSIPTTEEELAASRPPLNSRVQITQNSEAFDITDTGF
ncbi:MAG: hypothetical protein O6761_06995 [Thaumarchaeota archaeon]|nr:hypothetical protein [Nitrososphaerota archaeon]